MAPIPSRLAPDSLWMYAGPGAAVHVFCMAMLAVLASILDWCGPSWFQDHPLYVFRACGQAGLAQGLLVLPSLATSVFVATRSWWWQQAARLFLTSSFQVLCWLAWTASATSDADRASKPNAAHSDAKESLTQTNATGSATPSVPEAPQLGATTTLRPPDPAGARAKSPPLPGSPVARRLFLAATIIGCLLSAANALLHAAKPPPPSSPQLLLPGSVFELPHDITASAWALQGALLLATVPFLDHIAAALPRSFTPGEVGILVQGLLALAAGSCAYLAGASRQGLLHVLWSPHVVQLVEPDPGMHVPAFCMLVLFWVVMMAVCSAAALLGERGTSNERSCMAQESASSSTALPPVWNAASGVLPKGTVGAPAAATLRLRRAAASCSNVDAGCEGLVPVDAASSGLQVRRMAASDGMDGDTLDRVVATGIRAAAGGGAVLSFAMLTDLALWVLGRFVAASSRPRLATLAYWFGCLAVAVPFMYVVSLASAARGQEQEEQQHQQLQNHKVEQVEHGVGLKLTLPQQLERQQEGDEVEQGKPAIPMVQTDPVAAGRPCGRGLVGTGLGQTDAAVDRCNGRRPSRGSIVCEQQRQPGSLSGSPRLSGPAATVTAANVGSLCPGPEQQQQGRWRRRRSVLLAVLFRVLRVPHIVMRKGYHLLAIVLFLPAFGWDVRMLQASLAVAGAVLVFLEMLRCLGPMGLRRAIGSFMADFADARDSGPVYVTHFTLLLGIAVPAWLGDSVCGAAAGAMMAGLYGSEAAEPMPSHGSPLSPPPLSAAAARLLPSCRTVLGLSGLVSLGSGDTAAACVGFLLGRRRLFLRGKKTWEGTLSGAAAMLGSWAVVVWWMDVRWALSWYMWVALAVVTGSVALLEAVTQQLDNVVVPLYYLTHLVLVMTGN
ncbi:hypothetical protein VOLCADRAFT_102705 [Volvox carteri f. nagariensis]|uniref:dolichol kinase n=1 Tax=Volvox carteri f. nagariensis TaxID=3068 RepID=D8THJ6_VOLCA|nr:uncharacterized protein VOLCADRAFT_102705 [Volvox carteri f. nagariensis]EFJ53081.1 hypothetical protein VOLCADRAFT_102705 [Volvox carteri f. nagariensis]|eukprot:XP_002946086.1 hypothetical protein VOLCADRAFT_102705 [Volvox carteri f. nagariensis]